MIVKRMKAFSDPEQREFGIHKAANKAAKKAWEMGLARDVMHKAGYESKNFRTVPKMDIKSALKEVRKARNDDSGIFVGLQWEKLRKINNLNGRINEKATFAGDTKNLKLLNTKFAPKSKLARDAEYYHSNPYYESRDELLKDVIKESRR